MVGHTTSAANKVPASDESEGSDGSAQAVHGIVAVASSVLAEVDAALSAGSGTAPQIDLMGLSAALGGGQQLG